MGNGEVEWEGYDVCPPTSGPVSSLRAKLYRALAIIMAIKIMCSKYKVQSGHFFCYIDNKKVMKRLNVGESPSFR